MDNEEPILIQHNWDITLSDDKVGQQIPIHLGSVCNDDLPDVRFNIFSGMSDDNKLTVVVSKTVAEPAKATIKVSIDGREKKIVRMGCWITQCILDDILYIAAHSRSENTITVKCEIAWYGYTQKSKALSRTDLYYHTKKLLGTDKLTDMILMVEDEEISVHRIILAAQSSVFMSMFATNPSRLPNNNRIQVTNVDASTMKILIKFLYTGEMKMESSVDVLLSILAAAAKFKVTELMEKCEDAFSRKITINNALRILEGASACDAPKLIQFVILFMVDNKEEIARLDDFEDLYRRKPKLLFEFMMKIIGFEK